MNEENIQQDQEPVIQFEPTKKKLTTPIAIILGSLIIAGAILVGPIRGQIQIGDVESDETIKGEVVINPVTTEDHILGDAKKAKLFIVEFSDLECPFCKEFHNTLHKVVEHYDGKVAWVYRQFPLDNRHPKARIESYASECVAELGGNTAFWSYIDKIFEVTPSNDKLDLTLLPKFAVDLGINKESFETCLASGKYKDKVDSHIKDGATAGLKGTPYSIIIMKNGKKIPLPGTQSVEQIIKTIDPLVK